MPADDLLALLASWREDRFWLRPKGALASEPSGLGWSGNGKFMPEC